MNDIGKLGIAVAVIAAAIAKIVWFSPKQHADDYSPWTQQSEEVSAAGASASVTSRTWDSEAQWLISGVARDLAQLVAFAEKGDAAELASIVVYAEPFGTESAVEVKQAGRSVKAQIKPELHFWSTQTYLGLAKSLIADAKLTLPTTKPSSRDSVPQALTKPDTLTLIRESKTISAALAKAPLDAALHEEAALVIATLAFREAAGIFSDERPALGRITAHLTLARCVSETPTVAGLLAQALQLTLIKRQTDALKLVEALPPELSAWQRALKVRITSDWRLLIDAKDTTLLEQIALAHALAAARDASALADYLDEAHPCTIEDWSRIALGTRISVQEGHVFTEGAVETELLAASTAHRAAFGTPLARQDPEGAWLNATDTGAVQYDAGRKACLEPLSWGLLASFHQRHLMHVVNRVHYFYEDR